MKFIADLHVHSKYSRATAKNADLEHLYIAAQLKGIKVIATGDFTHPAWFAEICEKLIPAEPGLFSLKQDIASECDREVPQSCRAEVRFILETEISNIYKKNGATRKNHNLIYVPDFDTAKRLNAKLDAIGNIKSDGRPILGLDAKKLLEILLECSHNSFLIPAHIWTPWFSVFGSKSGFDSLKECFEDLSNEIFAVETGLSSDAPMNWRVSELDSCTLVSDSDSHSPGNLGRNANIFDTELSFDGIKSALKSKDPKYCLGTLDMYPEEGKYHADGHRKCNICLKPSESIKRNGLCPVCEKPLTLGVLHRVEALADRPEGFVPDNPISCHHIIPLAEILSEIFDSGVNSKTVNVPYRNVIEKLGPELRILHDLAIEDIEKAEIPLLPEAIRRMRAGNIHISPGYDGEYGKILVFAPGEKQKLLGQNRLFAPLSKPIKKAKEAPVSIKIHESKPAEIREELNPEQKQAIEHNGSPLLIIAGPGAGKTKTLTHRIAYLIQQRNILPENILAVTFTRRAAQEMQERLKNLLNGSPSPLLTTFHALCFRILKEQRFEEYSVIDDDERKSFISQAIKQVKSHGISVDIKPDKIADLISNAKQQFDMSFTQEISEIYQAYQALLASEKAFDYDDLIFNVVNLLESDAKISEHYIQQFKHVMVDEYQDINFGQYRLIRLLTSSDNELCVIGDPDQAIYGFRGSDVKYFQKFTEDYPNSRMIRLLKNYRSTETILKASYQLIQNHSLNPTGTRIYSGIKGFKTLTILETETEKAEAVAVGKLIEKMIGGMSFHSIDFGKTEESGINTDQAFSDFAVLYRTHQQSLVIAEIFDKAGIPYQIASRESFYKQKGIAELISLLKLCENKGLFTDIQKIGRLKISEKISEFQNQIADKSVSDKIKFLSENTELFGIISESFKRQQALEKILNIANVFENNIKEFLDTLALETDPDALDIHAQKVSLMTLHAAKGLEFPVVFIIGCENGFLPYERSDDTDEERRLLYVGMTRAKERLFVSYARNRTVYGKILKREISPFVKAIEDRLISLEKSEIRKPKSENKAAKNLNLF